MDVTPILNAIIALAVTIITSVLIPYIRKRFSAEQLAEIQSWVKIAVAAAEQIYNGQGRGPEKLKYVKAWLAEHGITYNESELDAMIEAQVYALKGAGK